MKKRPVQYWFSTASPWAWLGSARFAELVRPCHRAQYPFDAGGQALGVHRALEHAGLDAGARDALGDVADEELGHRLARPPPEEQRQRVERVDAGGDDDVQFRYLEGSFPRGNRSRRRGTVSTAPTPRLPVECRTPELYL